MDLIIAPYSVPMENADKAPVDTIAQYATDGNPAQGIPATILPAHVVNAIVAEIVNAIRAGGKTPDRNSWNQLADIIGSIMKKVGGDDDYFLKLKSETVQTVDSDVIFSKLLETNSQTVNGNVDIRGIEKSDGKVNISKMIHLWIRDDVSGWMNVEEIIGEVTNIVVGVQGGGTTGYFRLSNTGKLTCNDLQINESINCDTITANSQTVNGNVDIRGIEKSDGKTNISKMFHIWISENVSGWMNVEEIIGEVTNIVIGVQGGGTTGYFRLSNTGKLTCNSISTGAIDTSGDITINSGNRTWDDSGHFNGNALFCKKDDGLFYKLWLYDQLNVGSMVKLSVNDKYEYHFRDNGTIDAKEFNGVSMSSFCADLAEYYIADERYDPGTLVRIGGEKEITRASIGGFFYGVVSTSPAYVMNTEIRDERNALPVALAGRVPVLMTGMIDKGDPITISEISGVARKAGDGERHIGFSMENSHETSIRHVECVIKQN